MKKENIYWAVAINPGHDFNHVLLSHYKPHFLKSIEEWRSTPGDKDWKVVPVSVFSEKVVDTKYYEPRKVKITTEFI